MATSPQHAPTPAPPVPLEIAFDAPPAVREALARLARTEDVRFSPSGKRLAIAGFAKGRIAIADVEIARNGSGPRVAVTGIQELASPALEDPHGLDFADEETLVVGNRGGGVAVFGLTPASVGLMATTRSAPDDPTSLLDAPGSVAVRSEPGRREVLACNNRGNTITRHRLDSSGRLVAGEVVARRWLDIPDGLALSHDGRWLAISNHNTHSVLVYDYASLGEEAEPVGVLRGVTYPHGLRFGEDDRFLAVADAGAPFVHVFVARDGGWTGVAYPSTTVTVMDHETFLRGRHNTQEGGPKGIDVDLRTNVLAATAECLPLAFYDLRPALDREVPGRDVRLAYETHVLAETEARRLEAAERASEVQAQLETHHDNAVAQAHALTAELERVAAELERMRDEVARVGSDAESLRAELRDWQAALAHVHDSRSWRATAPLRRAFDLARSVRQRRPHR